MIRVEVMLQVVDAEKNTVGKPYKTTVVKETGIIRLGEEFSFSAGAREGIDGVPLIPNSWKARVVEIIWVEEINK